MNIYVTIIKYLLNNIYYNKYYNIILNKYKNNKYIYKLLLVISNLYTKLEKQEYSVEELQVLFHTSYPALQKDEAEFYESFFNSLSNCEVDHALAHDLFEQFLHMAVAEEIALLAVQVSQGQKKFDDLTTLLDSIDTQVVEEEQEEFTTTSIKEIYAAKISTPGLTWRLESLNRALGPLRKGNFGFLFARPEAGKTTFLASEVTFMGSQTDGNILWINNEQPGGDVVWRCYNALLGKESGAIEENLDDAEERWNGAIGSRLKFIDNPGIGKSQIELLCKKYDPKLIIFDQLDKVHGFDAERYDLLMKSKYQWARELSKKYGPVIGVCQAGGTAENKRYLEMTDVDSSHTAKQGEADWVLGIGKVNDAGYEKVRYLHLCKNKLPAGVGIDPALRHGKMEVLINEAVARYEDKIRW
jgi:replicative DNA helicase